MAAITDPLILPGDVLVVPVVELEGSVRDQLTLEDGEYAVTRVGARTPSRIIDAAAAELLAEFRAPQRIVDAVIRYSRTRGLDPQRTLEEAFPLLERFVHARLLVAPGSEAASPISPALEPGANVAGFEVQHVVQVLEDTEVYHVIDANGRAAALKIARAGSGRSLERRFVREAAILRHLDGQIGPALMGEGHLEGCHYLLIEWCPGISATRAATEHRRAGGVDGARRLLALCRAIVESYAHLHAQGVVHGDVHPRNVLVGDDGAVKIIDFGLARLKRLAKTLGVPARGGVDFYLEPEYARAWLAKRRPPAASMRGEQYALAALIYELMTGRHYANFSLEKDVLRRQVAEQEPLSFEAVGSASWPDVESALRRALAKDPRQRFPTVGAFAAELGRVNAPDGLARPLASAMSPATGPLRLSRLLDATLERVGFASPLLGSGLRVAPTASVNYGAAGIAYAVYRVACIREDPALLALADVWSSKALAALTGENAFHSQELGLTADIVGPTSLYHAAGGIHLVQALVSQAMGDAVSQQAAVEGFVAASRARDGKLDLTLGRAGSLLGCALLLEAMPPSPFLDYQPLLRRGEELAGEIWEEVRAFPPIAQCAEFPYLGIAHGWAGLLYASLAWCRAAGHAVPVELEERLGQLAELAEPAGRGVRWLIKVRPVADRRSRDRRRSGRDYMTGWCNGSAGYVHLWTLAHAVVGGNAHLTLAERAAWDAWSDRDSLGTLCCGRVGRAYALLNLSRSVDERSWFDRALALAGGIEGDSGMGGDHRDSLYKGEMGAAVLAADVSRPEGASLPVFEAEGWPSRLRAG